MSAYYGRGRLVTTYQVTCATCETQLQLGHLLTLKRACKVAREAGWGTFGRWGWYCPACLPYAKDVLRRSDAPDNPTPQTTAHETL